MHKRYLHRDTPPILQPPPFPISSLSLLYHHLQSPSVIILSKHHLSTSYPCAVLQRANILKEVQIMRGLDHPGIVQLVQFSESSLHYFLVLELMLVLLLNIVCQLATDRSHFLQGGR